MAARKYLSPAEEVSIPDAQSEPGHINDDLDDVFGSEPSSPTFSHTSREGFHARGKSGGNGEVSDIPRLKEKHETEGYRDGVTEGKAESVQTGFDEGYGLGATLGLRVGKILGVLEGVYNAVRTAMKDPANKGSTEWEVEGERVGKLYEEARGDLGTKNVFGRECWGEDGIWRFDVPGEKEDGREVTFPDVAAAHPLVVKWEGVVKEEVERWGLDLGLMEHENEHEEGGAGKGPKTEEEPRVSTAPGAAKELAW